MTTIQILDNEKRYEVIASSYILGRQYDNESEFINIIKPKCEANCICTMFITKDDELIDSIQVLDDPIPVRSNISQYNKVNISFNFTNKDGYSKNSDIKTFHFEKALKPDNFVPVDPIQKENINTLIGRSFTNVDWQGNDTLEFKNIKGQVVDTIQIKGSANGGTSNYNDLTNKPSINGIELQGNKTTKELGIVSEESDPTVPSYVKNITQENITKWNSDITEEQLNNAIDASRKYIDDTAKVLAGQNEYIGRYTGTSYTADIIQTELTNFVVAAMSREVRNGDLVNITATGSGVDYKGQQWRYDGNTKAWKYYIDFENHSVIDNLNSTSSNDGLSANQGKVLNDKIEEVKTDYVKVEDLEQLEESIDSLNNGFNIIDNRVNTIEAKIPTITLTQKENSAYKLTINKG